MNIFFCATVSQLSTVNKIMNTLPVGEKNMVVFMHKLLVNEEKLSYYTQKLQKRGFQFLWLDVKHVTLCKVYFKLLWLSKLSKVTLFFANRNLLEFLVVATYMRVKEVRTFDDGVLNLIVKKEEKLDLNTHRRYLIRWSRWNPQYLVENSVVHYTYFPNHPQIMKNLIPLSVIDVDSERKPIRNDLPPVRILLGQPIGEFVENVSEACYVEQILKEKSIDYYFPHPREMFELFDKSKVVRTPLLFEDYFSEFLADRECIIYTFFSTAVLYLNALPNVKIISLRPKNLIQIPRWIDSYYLFISHGIKVEDLEY